MDTLKSPKKFWNLDEPLSELGKRIDLTQFKGSGGRKIELVYTVSLPC